MNRPFKTNTRSLRPALDLARALNLLQHSLRLDAWIVRAEMFVLIHILLQR